MRDLLFLALTSGLACAPTTRSAPEPESGPQAAASNAGRAAALQVPGAQPDSIPVFLRHPFASRALVTCPMPVAIPDSLATIRMPTVRPHATHKMPVVRPGCVNPLFRRHEDRR
jgi:hypothetical protein